MKIDLAHAANVASTLLFYLACPWPLPALLGWHLSSTGRLSCTSPMSSYRALCELA